MSNDVPFESEAVCDVCGKKGAFDLMGDHICGACLIRIQERKEENVKPNKSGKAS